MKQATELAAQTEEEFIGFQHAMSDLVNTRVKILSQDVHNSSTLFVVALIPYSMLIEIQSQMPHTYQDVERNPYIPKVSLNRNICNPKRKKRNSFSDKI